MKVKIKAINWTVTNQRNGESVIYSSRIGPCDANHVLTAPSVKRWADGAKIKVRPT